MPVISNEDCGRGARVTALVFPVPGQSGEVPVDPGVPGMLAQAANAICFSPKEKSF